MISRLWLTALLATAPADAKKKVMFEDAISDTAPLDARLKPIPGVTVRLVCVTTAEPSDENHWRSACESTVSVERDGKALAKGDAPGIDFEAVAGNSGSLELSLLQDFIAVKTRSREGDEQSRETETETLYVVDGKTVREVFSYRPLEAYDPGPDGKDEERQRTTRLFVRAGTGTFALQEDTEITPLVWDKKRLVETPSLSSPEPLIARVLAGQRLKAGELKLINKDGLARLRNAPYARHGRAFKNPALQAFFYSDGKRKVDPAFKESSLDAADKANLSLILAEIKSR